ncbi:MAG: hypothetical protein M3249_01860 [Thermoproteota archaeon]|nr:hypothetical protein [Thermoproteota archaeon]
MSCDGYELPKPSMRSRYYVMHSGLIAFAFGIKAFMQVKQIISGSG